MINLSTRLKAVADFVEAGSTLADIGTDHGYIPVYLYQRGIIKGGVAADINDGPLSSCQSLIKQEGLCDAIKTRLSNGFDSIDMDEFDTAIIAGMGGELIADILSRAKLNDKHLILNPMTHPEVLRKYLYDNGFSILNDIIIKDGKHYYSIFDAKYTGSNDNKDELDYYLGNIKDFSNKGYFEHLLSYLNNKQKSGKDYSKIISALEAIL